MLKCQKCFCPNCEVELLKGCLNPKFCNPCHINRNKMCSICESSYSAEYLECPICSIVNK